MQISPTFNSAATLAASIPNIHPNLYSELSPCFHPTPSQPSSSPLHATFSIQIRSSQMAEGEKWKCPLCHQPLKSPVIAPCGHLFCWPCICDALTESPRCPTCDHELTKNDLIPIYGQTEEQATDDRPPPKQHREEPPPDLNPGYDQTGFFFDVNFFGFPGVFAMNFYDGRPGRNRNRGLMNQGLAIVSVIFPILLMILMSVLIQ